MGWHIEMAPDAPDIHVVVQGDVVNISDSMARQVSFPLWGLAKVIAAAQKVEQWYCTCASSGARSAPREGAPAPEGGCPVHTSRAERVNVQKWG